MATNDDEQLSSLGSSQQDEQEALRNASILGTPTKETDKEVQTELEDECSPSLENEEYLSDEEIEDEDSAGTSGKIAAQGRVNKSNLITQGSGSSVEQTKFKNNINFFGEDVLELLNGILGVKASPPSLTELSVELTETQVEVPAFISNLVKDNLEHYERLLDQQHALCIGCVDSEIALTVARSLLQRINSNTKGKGADQSFGQERLLSLASNPEAVADLNILSLSERELETDERTALIVDAIVETSHFLRPLSSLSTGRSLLKNRLASRKLVVICLVEFRPDPNANHQNKIPEWHLSLLQPLLEYHYPGEATELEKTIQAQKRRHGLWGNAEDTYYQVSDFIRRGDFPEVLRSREELIVSENPEKLFGNDAIADTAIYVATFFPGLNPREFQRVMAAFLGQKTKTIIEKHSRLHEEGKVEEYETKEERLLVDLWNENADAVMAQCSLGTILSRDSRRVVSFMKDGLSAQLKAHLEDGFPFFISNQVTQIQKLGLIFDDSTAITKNATRLLADLLVSDPDHGARLLVQVLSEIECSDKDVETIVRPGSALRVATKYQRVANIMRLALSKNPSVPAVNSSLEELIRTEKHLAAFNIISRLRGANHFDFFYWLRQLIERGNEKVKNLVLRTLYSIMAYDGTKVYEVLQQLQSWLKKNTDDRPLSASEFFAFRLVVIYCLESTGDIEIDDYGQHPSHLPLLSFSSNEYARNNLSLLINWLYHPRMADALGKQANLDNLIAALVAEWIFILIGPSRNNGEPLEANEPLTSPNLEEVVSAELIRSILIDQVFSSASPEQRRSILKYWQSFREFLLTVINALPFNDEDRRTLVWKRNLLKDLIREFKHLNGSTSST